DVVQRRRVGSRRDDRRIARTRRSLRAKRVIDLRLYLPLAHPAARLHHRALVRVGRNRHRVAHRLELRRLLLHPRLVNNVARIDYRRRPHPASRPHRLRPSNQFQHPLIDLLVESERVMHAFTLFEIARQNLFEFVDDVGLVGPVLDDRALDSRAPARPGLALLVARTHEHHELAVRMPRRKHRDRFRLRESCQVVEIAVLAINELDVAGSNRDRHARHDRGCARRDRLHHALAPRAKIVAVAAKRHRNSLRHAGCAHGNPARGTSTCVVSILPPRAARHFSGSELGAVATNSVRPLGPPSMHANASVSTLIRSTTSPPCFTRITSDMVGHATQTAFSASRQIPSGGLVPNSAHTRRLVSDPSAPISKAVKQAPNVSPAISVFASGVITIPFGNINSSATMRAAPSGATITSVVPRGVSPACRSNPKLPT